jgi:hypothetical protein
MPIGDSGGAALAVVEAVASAAGEEVEVEEAEAVARTTMFVEWDRRRGKGFA